MHEFSDTENDYPVWLQAIHATNELRPGTFLEPTSFLEVVGICYVEDYPDAQVVFPCDADRFTSDAKVKITGKNAAASAAIAEAVKGL